MSVRNADGLSTGVQRVELLTEQLQGALNSRIVIEQAKGVVAQLYGTSVDQAFELMRAYCRRHHQRLGALARAVVDDPKSASDLHR